MSVNSPSDSTTNLPPEPEAGSSNLTGPTPSPPRLYRSRQDRLVGGVCGGLGQYFGIDPVIVRLAFVLLLVSGVSLLAYVVLWIVIPERPLGEVETPTTRGWAGRDSREVFAWALIFLGLFFLLSTFQAFRWIDWSTLWPVLLIAIGAALLARHSFTS